MVCKFDQSMVRVDAQSSTYPITGVITSKVKMIIAIVLEKRITGQRRPRNGPSDSHTQNNEYTAVKAFPKVGYSFCSERLDAGSSVQLSKGNVQFAQQCRLAAGLSCYAP
jgi:hypothetical protein